MSRWLLKLLNDVLSKSRAVGVGAYFGAALAVWALVRGVASSLGVPTGLPRLVGEIVVSLALPVVLLLLRPLRWHFVYGSLRSEIPWFRRNRTRILVGVGPGGAIVAGMVAKLMAELDGEEPEIEVIDRAYDLDKFNQGKVSVGRARLKLASAGVIVVTSEIHAGGTIVKVCAALRARQIDAPVFSYLWSENTARPPKSGVDHFVLRTDQRGILPWPDAPGKNAEKKQIKT